MADLVRSKDWSKTPLGPIEQWPSSLRTTVSLCVASNFPIDIIWGPEHIQIYNDGYLVICGNSHPRALGEPFTATWVSAWPVIGEAFNKGLAGETSYLENQRIFIERNGYIEETFFTFSFSPIRDESGEVAGLFHPVTETTAAMLSERRAQALRELGIQSAISKSLLQCWQRISKTLMEFQFDFPSFVIFQEDGRGDYVALGENDKSKGMTEFSRWPVKEVLLTSQPVIVEDFDKRFGQIPCGTYPEAIQRAILIPIFTGDREKPFGFIAIALSTRLPFDDAYKSFLNLLGGSISARINNVCLKLDSEQERSRLSEVIMQIPVPIVILTGAEHRYTVVNEPYEQMVGRKILGKTVLEAFSIEEVKDFIPLLDGVYRTGQPHIGKALPFSVSNGIGGLRTKFLNVSYYPFRENTGEIVGVVAVHGDVTDEFNALETVKRNIDEQKDLNRALDFAKANAESASSAKSAFLANMSHEIRTPLAAILGFTEILKSADIGAKERMNYLDIIGRNGQALVRIIDDILDLSKIEAGKVVIERSPLCLSELLRDVVAMFSDRAHGKGISLDLNTENLPMFKIESDSIRIRQILINLIGNAIKFTTEGRISVRGHYKEVSESGIEVTLCITDTGIGLTTEQAQTLFKAFTQADNTTSRRYGGTGLGLALSQKLARAMGGDISIEKNHANVPGSTFTVTIRAGRCISNDTDVDPNLGKIGRTSEKKLLNWKILVVDDAPDNLVLLKVLLNREGARVDVAANGEDGISMALANDYNVVLMDIQMPGIDGYEALTRLRAEHYKKPIFALTAHAMKEERNRILAKGFTGHIAKPVNPNELVDSLLAYTRGSLH
jgi:signal transduction histidine kinase